MMQRLLMSSLMILVFAGAAFAQSGIEVFGGYSHQRNLEQGFNGFTGALTGNVTPWLGITADLGHNSTSVSIDDGQGTVMDASAKMLSYRFGPKFTARMNDSVSTFVHVLAGGTRMSLGADIPGQGSVSVSSSAFSAAAGGGIDFRVGPRIAIRPAQLEWVRVNSFQVVGESTGSSNGFRYSGGIVIRF